METLPRLCLYYFKQTNIIDHIIKKQRLQVCETKNQPHGGIQHIWSMPTIWHAPWQHVSRTLHTRYNWIHSSLGFISCSVIIFPVMIVKKHNMNIILVKNNEKVCIVVSIFFVSRKIRMKRREKKQFWR
jgi:hypothetical protein